MNTFVQTRENIVLNLEAARKEVARREAELAEWDQRPENFRFESFDEAYELEWDLRERASEDCEGSYNVGDDEYRQEFYVGDKKYVGILYAIFYNRHDKRYYYIDDAKFRIEDENGNKVDAE